MKKILILVIILPFILNFTSSSLIAEEVFSFSQTDIVTKPKFISPLYNDGVEEKFSLRKSIDISSKNGTYHWNIDFLRYTDATNADPGDYECIKIKYNGNIICKLKNDISWMKIENSLKSYTTNEYFIPIQLSDTSIAIILTGYQYPSDIQLLTIVIIDKDIAKLVFNKGMEINSITKTDNSFSMITQSNIQQWDENNKPLDAPIKHRIWSENGVLKFENL